MPGEMCADAQTVHGGPESARKEVNDMPVILDVASFQKSLATLPISTYEPGEMVIAAGATTGKLLLLRKV